MRDGAYQAHYALTGIKIHTRDYCCVLYFTRVLKKTYLLGLWGLPRSIWVLKIIPVS